MNRIRSSPRCAAGALLPRRFFVAKGTQQQMGVWRACIYMEGNLQWAGRGGQWFKRIRINRAFAPLPQASVVRKMLKLECIRFGIPEMFRHIGSLCSVYKVLFQVSCAASAGNSAARKAEAQKLTAYGLAMQCVGWYRHFAAGNFSASIQIAGVYIQARKLTIFSGIGQECPAVRNIRLLLSLNQLRVYDSPALSRRCCCESECRKQQTIRQVR